MERWISGLGLGVMLLMCFACCPPALRKQIKPRLVVGGILLQFGFAFLILKTPARVLFAGANAVVNDLLQYAQEGSRFVFGDLVSRVDSFGFIFAFQVLPSIVFFSALISVLYYLGVMQWMVTLIGGGLAYLLGTSQTESVAAAANIFLGQIEAPLVVKPYIDTMTRSELLALMVPGMASIAGGVLAAYVGLLNPYFPDIAGHLLAASFMSAPAALVTAKIILPESDFSATQSKEKINFAKLDANLIDAATRGTREGVGIAVGVGATLIAFIALVALVNALLGNLGQLFGLTLTLQSILGLLFAPLAWLMGISTADIFIVGNLLGQKLVLNEFVAYTTLAEIVKPGGTELSHRSVILASYALCGFANLSSVGIQVAGIGSLAPGRRVDLARLGLRALFAGSLATFMTAAIVGILI
ncbi:NupC/NupG family nucleoside CNT transporter [Anthocerotibacter panamensis]|uniref:NupC/NupG family nucleoside CNT transporter n=1 Tax=Anthocerotibacter panamensis TaxID=2857077 RepID=UPI001C408953|nr:nucleoside transporter C-terminal domain-containing protein [Anthocerotibacter panamensis]